MSRLGHAGVVEGDVNSYQVYKYFVIPVFTRKEHHFSRCWSSNVLCVPFKNDTLGLR